MRRLFAAPPPPKGPPGPPPPGPPPPKPVFTEVGCRKYGLVITPWYPAGLKWFSTFSKFTESVTLYGCSLDPPNIPPPGPPMPGPPIPRGPPPGPPGPPGPRPPPAIPITPADGIPPGI